MELSVFPGGIALDDEAVADVLNNDGAGSDHNAIADSGILPDNGVGADVASLADVHVAHQFRFGGDRGKCADGAIMMDLGAHIQLYEVADPDIR